MGPSASDIITWLAQQPDLTTTGRKPAQVRGLQGEVVDLKMTTAWPKACKTGGTPFAPVIIGTGTSQLEHALSGVVAMRPYLLDHTGEALAVEIDDIRGGAHLDAYFADGQHVPVRGLMVTGGAQGGADVLVRGGGALAEAGPRLHGGGLD